MCDGDLLDLGTITERIESALAASTADETSIAWLEFWRRRAGTRRQRRPRPSWPQRSILIRALEGGRLGTFRCCDVDSSALEFGIRQAIGHARAERRVPDLSHLPHDDAPLPDPVGLFDEQVAALRPERAHEALRALARPREAAHFDWSEVRMAVASTCGLRRAASATSISLEVRCGKRPGFGYASAAARSLADLAVEDIFERARSHHASESAAPADGAVAALLSPEAAAQLFALLGRVAFTAQSYRQHHSFLRDHLGVQVFDRSLSLVDDGADAAGLPFPFDLEGSTKRRVDLIRDGCPQTPALDQIHAAMLGLHPTAHAWAGDDARAEHLLVEPGETAEDDLLLAADGGIWISLLERLECFDTWRLRVKAVARGVRRIRRGSLAEGLPDLRWDSSLLESLSQLRGLGVERIRQAHPGSLIGSVCCPAILLAESSDLKALDGA